MTDESKAAQFGEVTFAIKRHERELSPLLVRAKQIGARLVIVGEQLRDRPFGISDAANSGVPRVVGGGTYGTDRELFDYDALTALELEIGEHARELHRLRQLKAQLEP
jgi:hypothetical protein